MRADREEGQQRRRKVARPRHGLHVLRHFYASWLIDQGFAPKRVQELMGHSTIKLTLDTYGHLWPDNDAEAARFEAAEAALLALPSSWTRQGCNKSW